MIVKVITDQISLKEVKEIAKEFYGNMIKGVADLEKNILALGGEMHADAETALLHEGSQQKYLWGFNILLDRAKEDALEYTSFINIRPKDGNRNIELQDLEKCKQIKELVWRLVDWSQNG